MNRSSVEAEKLKTKDSSTGLCRVPWSCCIAAHRLPGDRQHLLLQFIKTVFPTQWSEGVEGVEGVYDGLVALGGEAGPFRAAVHSLTV